MVDFVREFHLLSVAGFGSGYFMSTEKHIRFNMLHHSVTELWISVIACFHDKEPEYWFRLFFHEDCLYEGPVHSDEDMESVVGEIKAKVAEVSREGGTDARTDN